MKRFTARLLGSGVAGAMLVGLAVAQPAISSVPHCPRILTMPDSGKTITLKRGTCATLRLGTEDWSRPASSNSDVAVATAPASSGAQQWFLKAVHAGSATITSDGRPRCNPHEACPDFIILLRLRIHVVA